MAVKKWNKLLEKKDVYINTGVTNWLLNVVTKHGHREKQLPLVTPQNYISRVCRIGKEAGYRRRT